MLSWQCNTHHPHSLYHCVFAIQTNNNPEQEFSRVCRHRATSIKVLLHSPIPIYFSECHVLHCSIQCSRFQPKERKKDSFANIVQQRPALPIVTTAPDTSQSVCTSSRNNSKIFQGMLSLSQPTFLHEIPFDFLPSATNTLNPYTPTELYSFMQRQLNTEDNVTAMQCPVNTAPPTKKQTLPSSAKSGQTAKSSNDGFRQIKIRKTRTQYNEYTPHPINNSK